MIPLEIIEFAAIFHLFKCWCEKAVIRIPLSINHIVVFLPAHRAILRRTWQEELQQLQNVPVVPTRLRRGAVRGRTGPPDPILPRRLRQPVAPIQSQHQLRGLLLHHTEAFKQGEQVHRLPRLLGLETKRTPCTLSFTVCFRGCLCVGSSRGWVRCMVVWKVEDACECVCICVETVLNDQGLVRYVQLLTKSDHVHSNADKHKPFLHLWPSFRTKKNISWCGLNFAFLRSMSKFKAETISQLID